MDYEQTIKVLKKFADVDTIKELSDILDVNYATFNTWATRKEIPLKRIKEFSEKLGIDMNLITNPEMDNYKELVKEMKLFFNVKSLEEVAERLGYKKNNANNWRNNKQLSAQALKKYYELKKANNSVSIHHHKDTITIRYFPDICASAGFGNANENENFQIINIDKAFLTDVLGVPYKTQYDMIKIYGESMEPFIQNGSFIIIDTTKNSLEKIRNADVVIFRDNDNELFCKRILKNAFDDDIVISSDNFNFGDKKIKKSALKNYVFIGVVVCSCNAKIFLNQIERV
ncbi:S24 family peptidase [Campylobacter jejuni]|uniref:LexA family transcriptional regulator n=2 Tax=Campylobacter jejuni TaxID=197 RepID=UPI00366E0CCD